MTLTNMEFYIIEPCEATNEVTNPSIEVGTTGYTAVGAGVSIARVTTQQRRGVASLEVTTATGVASGAYFGTVNEVSGVARTFSVDVYGTAGQAMRVQIRDTSANVLSETTFTANGHWQRIKVTRTGSASTTRRLYVVRDAVASTAKFYVDGLYYGTVDGTYLDGDMAGFIPKRKDYRWNGTPHASTSWRSGDTRSGGTLLRIKDYARIVSIMGLGMNPVQNIAHPMTINRSSFQGTRSLDREFILTLAFANTHDTMQASRAVLQNAVNPDRCVVQQPMIIRYQGLDSTGADASDPIDIYAHYVDGLGNNPDNPGVEIAPVRFQSFIPFVARDGESGVALGYKTSVSNFANIGYRDVDGRWKVMGTGVTGGAVNCMAKAPDGSIYVGGNFTSAGGVANTAYLAKWNGTAFESVVAGLNAYVSDIVITADGSLYFSGGFTDAGGVAAADRIAKLTGSTVTALGTGVGNNYVFCLALGPDGSLYAGGNFTTAGGVANATGIAKWTGSAWVAMGTGVHTNAVNIDVEDITVGNDGSVYIGGEFTDAGSVANTAYMAKWNGTAWVSLGVFDALVKSLATGKDGSIYASGDFTTAGSVAAARIARWNGTAWTSIGGLTGGKAYSMATATSGELYAAGDFTAAGGVTLPERIGTYRSGTWIPLDINVNDSSGVFTEILPTDDGRLYIGGNWTGTTALSATVTASTSGGARAYPILTVTGPGTVYQLKNYTTGKSIYFNGLTLQAGESMTLDLRQARFKFTSSWRGNLSGYIANGSNLDWFLQGGANNVSLLMLGDTAASSAFLRWQDLHQSIDEAKY